MHILNDVHNNRHYNEISKVASPQGLVALMLSTPIGTDYSNNLLAKLDSYDPGITAYISDSVGFQIFCERVVEEIDSVTRTIFQNLAIATPPFFYKWSNVSHLQVVGSVNESEIYDLQRLSAATAEQFRHYNGMVFFECRDWLDF